MEEKKQRLKITEVFFSLQGEANCVGQPTIFIRLTGCPLRCSYCDSEYTFTGGKWASFNEILKQISSYGIKRICVTGGEPLSQQQVIPFLMKLCDSGYQVSLETSGLIDVQNVDKRVEKVIDVKTPSSNEVASFNLNNLKSLTKIDQLKFVISNDEDYQWSNHFIKSHPIPNNVTILFSASYGKMSDTDLANKIVKDRLPVRFQIQLHKYLWGDKTGV